MAAQIAGMDMKGLKKLMSDDLISRKALIADMRSRKYIDKALCEIFETIVNDAPIAFGKEKVIEEIQAEGDIAELHELHLLYNKKVDNEEQFKRMQFELDRGYSVAMFRAKKIVEKGGIE